MKKYLLLQEMLLVLGMVLVLPMIASGTAVTRYVSSDSAAPAWPFDSWLNAALTIQQAVDAANANNAGDHVVISNGTYTITEPVFVSNVVVRSYEGDRSTVIVSGNYPTTHTRCFILQHPQAVLRSLTITKGSARTNELSALKGSGGGVWAEGGRLEDCLITACRAEVRDNDCGGGGIYASGTTLEGCAFIGNSVRSMTGSSSGLYITGGGGGALLSGSGSVATNCYFALNEGVNGGGGVSGGGICMKQSGVRVLDCTIVSNKASVSGYGGGIFARSSSGSQILNCRITENDGGGIWLHGELTPMIRNCIISHNKANNVASQGLFFHYVTKPEVLESCTIVSNAGAGLWFESNCKPNKTNFVSNCIIYGNGGEGDLFDKTATGLCKTSVWYSCVGSVTGFEVAHAVTQNPSLVDPNRGDYRLSAASPCINQGVFQAWMLGAQDYFGNRRVMGGAVDLGAHEYLYSGTVLICR